MYKSNPACYECPKGKNKLHTWERNIDKTAKCKYCKLKLTVEQAEDVWRE